MTHTIVFVIIGSNSGINKGQEGGGQKGAVNRALLLYTCLVYERRLCNWCLVVHMYGVFSELETYTKGTGSYLATEGFCLYTQLQFSMEHCDERTEKIVIEPSMFSLRLSTPPFYLP